MSKRAPRYQAILFDSVPHPLSLQEGKYRMSELKSLVDTFGDANITGMIQKHNTLDYHTFLTKGSLDEVLQIAKERGADLLILGNILKPRQIFELSELLRKEKIQVWDRIDLILNIFSLHAKSAEAKLQIDLAKIRHMGPRIYGMGSELSQQGAGIGTRGIGETNTEIMRRHLQKDEERILKNLEKISKVREGQRLRRKKYGFQNVAIIGYTNAGKSTLMNALTRKGVLIEDALFATLDTRIGKLFFPALQENILFSDTIGFIADLPPSLIAAFRSTLSEAIHADLLLHVVDVDDPRREEKIQIVDQIITDLKIENIPQILVFNKIDSAKKRFGKIALSKKYLSRTPVFLSAQDKNGLDELKEKIEKSIKKNTSNTN
jgi:GTPase